MHVSALPYDLGDRALGCAFVQWVLTTQYGATPEGIRGNDDGGATSAWWFEAALGLHPIAGTDEWTLGTPLFPRVEIDVGGGDTLVITNDDLTDDADGKAPTHDDVVVDGPRLRHSQLTGTIAF